MKKEKELKGLFKSIGEWEFKQSQEEVKDSKAVEFDNSVTNQEWNVYLKYLDKLFELGRDF